MDVGWQLVTVVLAAELYGALRGLLEREMPGQVAGVVHACAADAIRARFSSVEELIAQMHRDVEEAREVCASFSAPSRARP